MATFHPQHLGMVGLAGLGAFNMGADLQRVFRLALGKLWDRDLAAEEEAESIAEIADDFEKYVDAPLVRVRYSAVLRQLKCATDEFSLADGLVIRRMSQREVSRVYGGPLELRVHHPAPVFGIDEFRIEGVLDSEIVFDQAESATRSPLDIARTSIDTAIVALRTFKPGRVGYHYVDLETTRFTPLLIGSYGTGELHLPFGSYQLESDEVEALCAHHQVIAKASEPAMATACFRLAESEARVRPEDRLVDCVIGMEALLLSGLAPEDRKSELKFRFALNYAMLFSTSRERRSQFRVAKDLYNLRSLLAHGGKASAEHRVGDEKISVVDAAKRASDALRYTVHSLLPMAQKPIYRQPEFWEEKYFDAAES